jgi:hypothetical protein
VERRAGFDDSDSGHWTDDGRRRDCAERVWSSWAYLSPSLGEVFFRKLIAALMSRQSRKRNCRRLRRSLLFCICFARERTMKREAAEIGEASLTVYDHTFRRSGAPSRAHLAEGSSNTRAPGGTFTATQWRRRSKQRSERCRRAASCESWPAISLRSTRTRRRERFDASARVRSSGPPGGLPDSLMSRVE